MCTKGFNNTELIYHLASCAISTFIKLFWYLLLFIKLEARFVYHFHHRGSGDLEDCMFYVLYTSRKDEGNNVILTTVRKKLFFTQVHNIHKTWGKENIMKTCNMTQCSKVCKTIVFESFCLQSRYFVSHCEMTM